MRVDINKIAERDMLDIIFFISMDNCAAVAQKQLDKLMRDIRALEHAPDIGSWVRLRTNRATNNRYLVSGNYVVIYKIEPEYVEIIRVFDGRTDWQKEL